MGWLRWGWLAAALATACGGRTDDLPVEVAEGGGGSAPVVAPIGPSERLDVVLVVDDGLSADVGRPLVSRSLAYFIDRLTSPRCTNGFGQIVDNPGPGQPCEVGRRDFAPIDDVHIAVLSSSLGSAGADTCTDAEADDGARPLDRDVDGEPVPTYEDLGFLVWDPDGEAEPPGESDQTDLSGALRRIVLGAGGEGCLFPAPLEAARRFLVDPQPPAAVVRQGDATFGEGIDDELLALRASFLRPDSVVLVAIVTPRDDCSIAYGAGFPGAFRFAQATGDDGLPLRLNRAREECAVDPTDPCCAPCGASVPSCPPSPACSTAPVLTAPEDPIELRCFDPVRRFGRDDRFPLERYRAAFSDLELEADGRPVANPLFAEGRRREQVIVSAVTGVPWQDIAITRDSPAGGLLPGPEVPWSRLLADGAEPPGDPLMIPSVAPRAGEQPVTGDALAPPSATSPTANPINGHEHALTDRPQYSCTTLLPSPVSCGGGACECIGPAIATNPVCQADDGTYGTTQRFARATPAPRLLSLVRDLGPQGVVGTVCAPDLTDASVPAFGIKPSVDAWIRRLVPLMVPADEAQ